MPTALENAIAETQAKIDRDAGQARLKYITATQGQEATYREKYEDAKRWKADAPVPPAADTRDPAAYPYLTKEAAERGMTADALADEIIQTRDGWTEINATIEALRVSRKKEAEAATNPEDVKKLAEIDWP